MISFLLLLALIPFAFLRSSQVPEAEAAWWNESWRYRQSIAVTNNTTQQANVYITVSLDTSNTSKFQADCGDLRFTKQNGQLLPYYIVSGCGTASTSVHVQLDTFPAGAQTFFAYYGNPSADNGFSSNDFLTQATNYTVGGTGGEETGPGPVAYWKFDEGSGSTTFDSANYGTGNELLTDGNMEAADTSAWKVAGTISKISSNPAQGSRALRVENNTGKATNVWAYQEVVEPGKQYRVTGWMRSNGIHNPTLYFITPAVVGTSSTDWQRIDAVVTTDANRILFGAISIADSGYVEFDDVSIREVTSGNHGTVNGAMWTSEEQCVSGKCLTFDGTSDYVATPRQISSLNKGFTIQAWAYLTASSGWRWIVGEASDSYFFIGKSNQGNFMHIGFNGVFGASNISEAVFHPNQWYHVTVAWDGTTNSNSIKIYLNGGLVAQRRATSTSLSNGNLNIGRRSISEFWQGQIDEVKIFPYALTEDQIKTEYNLGAAAVMGTGPTVAPPAGGTLSDSLVAHWAFDEQYGQTAHDKVGNNHGTFGGSTNPGSDDPTWTAAGECKVNGCLGFGGGDYIQPSTSDPFKITSKSVTFWGNLTSIPNTFRLAVGGNSINWYTGFASNGRMVTSHANGTGSQRVTYSSTSILTDNSWDHYAYTWDVNGSIVTVRLYKNGKLVGGDDFADGYSSAYGSLFILGALSPSSAFFQGKLDELKIYNVALTADQVKQDMNAGASVVYSVGSEEADELADGAGAPPIAEWKFDEKQGTVAYDSSGHANDGTVNGATWKSGCQQGACLEFDGVDDYARISYSSGLNPTNFTLSAWIQLKDINKLKRQRNRFRLWQWNTKLSILGS